MPNLPHTIEMDEGELEILTWTTIGAVGWIALVDPVLYEADLRLPTYPWGDTPPEDYELEFFVARRLKVIFFAMEGRYVEEMVIDHISVVERGEYNFTVRLRFAEGEPAMLSSPGAGGPSFGYRSGAIFF